MPGCTADYCTNSSAKGFKMCSFPSDPERRQIWVKNMGRDNWTPTSNCRLCEVHFESTMWERQRLDGKKKLKFNAVPTLFGKHIPHRDATCDITPQSVEIADTSSNPSVISSEINLVEPETETEISSEGTVEFEATDTNIVSTDFSKSNEHLERMRKLLLKSERLRKKMKKKLISAKKTIKRLQSRVRESNFSDAIKKVLNEDQIKLLTKEYKKLPRWCNESLVKGFKLKFLCGSSG